MLCSLSTKLGPDALQAISALEKELATSLLASCHQIRTAEISPEQLTKIQTLENQLGISLVAIKA
jgi:hypothetical protein